MRGLDLKVILGNYLGFLYTYQEKRGECMFNDSHLWRNLGQLSHPLTLNGIVMDTHKKKATFRIMYVRIQNTILSLLIEAM